MTHIPTAIWIFLAWAIVSGVILYVWYRVQDEGRKFEEFMRDRDEDQR